MPPAFAATMVVFQPLFSKPVFQHAMVLLAGAILTPGRRTVAHALRIMGLSYIATFQNYHRVLSRASWSARKLSHILLLLLVRTFAPSATDPDEPLVFGIDETIEGRRRGRIRAKGIYRDPVRSSHGHFVKASGLRWMRLMVLAEVLSDERTSWQQVLVSHWYGRQAYQLEIASSSAVWLHMGMPALPVPWVLVRDPSGKLAPKAFLCTDLGARPVEILSWFVRRWQVEVTFEEVRRHLGVETQRQWSEKAIARTTACLLGLFSLLALMAERLHQEQGLWVAGAAWYAKQVPTFSDALAAVRRQFWQAEVFQRLCVEAETVQISRMLFNRLTGALCYAA